MAKKWPLAIATYILIPLVKVLSDGGDEVQYQGFCLIFDIDGASSIKIFTLLSIFVWVKLVVPKSDLFLCTLLQPTMYVAVCTSCWFLPRVVRPLLTTTHYLSLGTAYHPSLLPAINCQHYMTS